MKAVTFEAGGRELALRMDMNALVRYQDRSGETIMVALQAIVKDGEDAVRGRRMFWAALSERMTEDEAGDLMSEIGIGRAFDMTGTALGYAIRSMRGDVDAGGEAEAGNAPKPRKKAT
jgi:hypothetical protein